MNIPCCKCGTQIPSTAPFCYNCGAKQNVSPIEKTPAKPSSPGFRSKSAGTVIAIILAVLQLLIVVLPIVAVWSIEGADFGRYDFDDIVFDFLKTFGNRLTQYQRTVKHIRRIVMLCQLLLIPAGLGLFLGAKKTLDVKTRDQLPLCLAASVFSHFGLLSSLFMLCLYSYNGLTRTLTFAVFFISAALCLVGNIFIAKKLGGKAILVALCGLLLAALITSIYVPLLGICVVTFGDLSLLLGIALLCCGSGGGSATTVYVVVI